ncbi:CD1247 N-terminal domain-containing protein [Andreesenia angusta]|uniref:CD1247 N-terminal domain-containing protein n=1 Tax=Andreesenia angusta TaxID=39480 RepID=UPI0008D99CFA|nr:CD1247 N-terminal domain-containing protein [Andreesenia angusta]
MQYLYEKVAYLRGLAEGLEIDDSTKEGKLLKSMIVVMEDMVDAINENTEEIEEISSYVEIIDEDLSEMEDIVYDEDDDEDDYYDDEDFEYIELVCPSCGEEISVDRELIDDGEVFCPNCEEKIEI